LQRLDKSNSINNSTIARPRLSKSSCWSGIRNISWPGLSDLAKICWCYPYMG
jgi:hypothetical protein